MSAQCEPLLSGDALHLLFYFLSLLNIQKVRQRKNKNRLGAGALFKMHRQVERKPRVSNIPI